MNQRLEGVFSSFLAHLGALAPVQLGVAPEAAPDAGQVESFLRAVDSCRSSTRRAANLLLLAYLALLLGGLVLLYMARMTNANTSIVALMGSSGVIGLVVIPVRMQSLWKDLTLIDMTLAVLPGLAPKDQMAMVKTLHTVSRSKARG